jgi:tRNA(Ile2) C34 agmatinyltransferase TiaS
MGAWEDAQGPPCPGCGQEMLQRGPDGLCRRCWEAGVRREEQQREQAARLLAGAGSLMTPGSRRRLRRIIKGTKGGRADERV